MEIEVKSQSDNEIVFIIRDAEVPFVNAIRRCAMVNVHVNHAYNIWATIINSFVNFEFQLLHARRMMRIYRPNLQLTIRLAQRVEIIELRQPFSDNDYVSPISLHIPQANLHKQ